MLSGCVNITDATLVRLSVALSQPRTDSNPQKEEAFVNNNRPPVKCVNGEDCLCEMYYRAHHKNIQPCNDSPYQSRNTMKNRPAESDKIFVPTNGHHYEGGVVGPGKELNNEPCNNMYSACDGENRVSGSGPLGTGKSGFCHIGCAKQTSQLVNASAQIEDCAISANSKSNRTRCRQQRPEVAPHSVIIHNLKYLNLSGCFQVTDLGLR